MDLQPKVDALGLCTVTIPAFHSKSKSSASQDKIQSMTTLDFHSLTDVLDFLIFRSLYHHKIS